MKHIYDPYQPGSIIRWENCVVFHMLSVNLACGMLPPTTYLEGLDGGDGDGREAGANEQLHHDIVARRPVVQEDLHGRTA